MTGTCVWTPPRPKSVQHVWLGRGPTSGRALIWTLECPTETQKQAHIRQQTSARMVLSMIVKDKWFITFSQFGAACNFQENTEFFFTIGRLKSVIVRSPW